MRLSVSKWLQCRLCVSRCVKWRDGAESRPTALRHTSLSIRPRVSTSCCILTWTVNIKNEPRYLRHKLNVIFVDIYYWTIQNNEYYGALPFFTNILKYMPLNVIMYTSLLSPAYPPPCTTLSHYYLYTYHTQVCVHR